MKIAPDRYFDVKDCGYVRVDDVCAMPAEVIATRLDGGLMKMALGAFYTVARPLTEEQGALWFATKWFATAGRIARG